MKRYLSLFLVLAMLGGIFALPVSAASAVETSATMVEYFEDGSYAVTTITETSLSAPVCYLIKQQKSNHFYCADLLKIFTAVNKEIQILNALRLFRNIK